MGNGLETAVACGLWLWRDALGDRRGLADLVLTTNQFGGSNTPPTHCAPVE
jgi:hypothetical protein